MRELLRVLDAHSGFASVIVAALALLTSVVAIVVSAVSMYLQREHNYKSLTPIASFPVGDYEDKIAVNLSNSGIGPLIVTSLRVTDGKETTSDLISWMPDLPEGIDWATFYSKADGACVPAGSALALLKLAGDPEDLRFSKARDNCRRALGRLRISIVYKDIYQRTMPTVEKDLSWFGRHFV